MSAPTPNEQPRPPEGIVIVYNDGQRVPCEVYYDGIVNGAHMWVVTTAIDSERFQRLHVDLLPPQTSISVDVIPIEE